MRRTVVAGAGPGRPEAGAWAVIEDPAEPDLASAVEWYLLEAQLAPAQRETLRRWGWSDLPWPEQVLVLRVSATRFPVVEAYQPCPHGARRAVPGAPPAPTSSPGTCTPWTTSAPPRPRGPCATAAPRASPLGPVPAGAEAHRGGGL